MGVSNRKFALHIYVTVFLLLLVTFFAGIVIGRSVSFSKENEIANFIKNAELNTESYLLEQDLIERTDEGYCEFANTRLKDLSSGLQEIHGKLIQPGSSNVLGSANFNLLKRKYWACL